MFIGIRLVIGLGTCLQHRVLVIVFAIENCTLPFEQDQKQRSDDHSKDEKTQYMSKQSGHSITSWHGMPTNGKYYNFFICADAVFAMSFFVPI